MKGPNNPVRSRFRIGTLLLLPIIGVGLLYFIGTIVSTEMDAYYHTIPTYLIAGLVAIFGLIPLYYLFSFRKLYIYDDRIVVRSILGFQLKTIDRSAITGWGEVEVHDYKWKMLEFTIYADSGDHIIRSYVYQNYEALTNILRKDTPELVKPLGFKRRVSFLIFFKAFLGSIMLFVGVWIHFTPQKEVKEIKLVSFIGTIDNDAEYVHHEKEENSIIFGLVEYPGYRFQIEGSALNATRKEAYVEEVFRGDTLVLQLEQNEYEEKLKQPKPKGAYVWFDETNIAVYGLSGKSGDYLSFSSFANVALSERNSGSGMGFVIPASIFFIALAIYNFVKGPQRVVR